MPTLVQLVNAGIIGASLAFLLVSYWLLNKEISLKDANNNPAVPRPEILDAIRKFRWSALAFFLVGVLSEFTLSSGKEIVYVWEQHLFGDSRIKEAIDTWEFYPQDKKIGYSLVEERIKTSRYILPGQQEKYHVYVGVRRQMGDPVDRGKYDIIFGPYAIGNTGPITRALTNEEVATLGDGCIEFAAFGTESNDVPRPFLPETVQAKLLSTAAACLENQ
jgi:hypothetical protein